MRTVRTPDRLLLRNSPGGFWILGVLFIAVGALFVLCPSSLRVAGGPLPLIAKGLGMLMGVGTLGAGGFVLRCAPLTRCEFNRHEVVVKRGLAHPEDLRYPLAAIQAVRIAEQPDGEGTRTYRVELLLHSGQRVPLSAFWGYDRFSCERAVQATRSFLGFHEPAAGPATWGAIAVAR